MKERSAREKENAGTAVKFVPADMLDQRNGEIQNMIARRAYELFEHRGRVPGHEIEDWEQAETELLLSVQTRFEGIGRGHHSSRRTSGIFHC